MEKIKKICKCGKKFEVYPSLNRIKSCSMVCARKYRLYPKVIKSHPIFTCKCGKKFDVYFYRKDIAKFCSKKCANKFRKHKLPGYKCPKGSLSKLGSKNPQFGKIKENPSYEALHEYIHKRIDHTKPKNCQHCGEEKKLEMANKSRTYKRDLKDWLWLCKKCHFKYDGGEKYLALGRGPNKNYKK